MNELPIPAVVERILTAAVLQRASDIHLCYMPDGLTIRLRVDGVLYPCTTVSVDKAPQVLSRIKVLAHIDIAQQRIPQDGKFCIDHDGRVIDIRVSTFPALHGESMVLRILDRDANELDVLKLGMSDTILKTCQQLLSRSSGFFLVTGPTGSGKTTTLYASLCYVQAPDKHIITLEDPVEYNLAGITQGQVHPQAGFSFERGIRALLRQDPDIAMIGEIRDEQTARIALQAALTGHLVLSTLHTTDAPSAIVRLMDMGVEPFLINAALTGVLAQRLVRTLCNACKRDRCPDEQEQYVLKKLGLKFSKVFYGAGCDMCHGRGYQGRTGIFQLLVFTDAIRALVIDQPQYADVYAQAVADGMQSLTTDGANKVREGIISVRELARVVC